MAELYQISFPNGKSYIGVTSETATARFAEHAYNSKRRDRGRAIERAIRKYGVNAATVKTLVIGAWEYLIGLEKAVILAFGTFGRGGYNMTAGGEGALGYKHTSASLIKMGLVHKGKAHHTSNHTHEAKLKMSLAHNGKKLSAEHRENIRRALIGNKYCVGVKHNEAVKRNASLMKRGRTNSNKSGAVGVSFDTQTTKWRSAITVRGRTIHLGRYDSFQDAIVARQVGEASYFAYGGYGREISA